MTAPVTDKPSSGWKDGIAPRGAISGRQLGYKVPPRAGSAPAVREVRSHRRSGVERLELVAAALAGSATTLLILLFIEKVIRRG